MLHRKYCLLVLSLLVLICTTGVAQQTNFPDGIVFQAIATDPSGNPAANKTVFIKDAIIHKYANGQAVYSETFKVVASKEGVFTIVIVK